MKEKKKNKFIVEKNLLNISENRTKNYENIFIGLGGAGNNLLNTLTKETNLIISPKNQCYYVNFSKTDLSDNFKGQHLLLSSLNGEGTGKSLEKGKEIVKENIKYLTNFCENIYKNHFRKDLKERKLIIISSLGGGTGSSLLPIFFDYFSEFSNIKIIFFGVLSSRKEGVTTLPNSLKNFETIYNNYILNEKITSSFLLDNAKFESKDDPFNFIQINKKMSMIIEEILDDSFAEKTSEGYQALDLNEKRRVMWFGKGLSDFYFTFLKENDEIKIDSSILNEKFDSKKAKAISILIEVREKEENLRDSFKSYLSSIIKEIKKQIPNAFFVFGYTFNNKNIPKEYDCKISCILNGLEFPKTMTKNIEIAKKAVEKIKEKNNIFENSDDLSF